MRFGILILIIFTAILSFGQSKLHGYIYDENNEPIPLAKIYIKNSPEERTICTPEGYFEMYLLPGEYFLVIGATGYEQREVYVAMHESNQEKLVSLFPIQVQDIEELEVSTKKTNPGREIMLEVVKRRDTINPWNRTHSCEVYIKAVEKINREEEEDKKKDKKKKKQEDEEQNDIEDPFAEQRKADQQFANSMNLVEVQLTRNYAPANQVKEVRNAYEKRGDDRNMYYTTTVKSNFNFFENLLHLDDLHQTPVSSPISGPGILSYKYRLVEQYEENGQKIHKIKIIPRNVATTTLEGYIWVIDSIWMVQKLELTMQKGNLLIYDYFTIQQEYENQGDSLSILTKQILDYGVKYKNETISYQTAATFEDYNFDVTYNKKYFNNELSITEKEAYDKDSTYWAGSRKFELTEEEKRYILVQDSIRDYQNRKEYLDSVDQDFNKITALKVLWFGVDHRNRDKKNQWTISSIAAMARPIYIAGPRVAPSVFYFKKWDNERTLDSYTEASYGFLNNDIKGSTWWRYRYDPFHLGTISGNFQHDFGVIRSYDAISQIYKRDNFIEKTELSIDHNYEIYNGLELYNEFSFSERRSLKGYNFLDAIDEELPNNDPLAFKDYQAFIGIVNLSYTPGRKYMREPNRKVILGSKWPTIYAYYERGIPGLFGSDINHEYGRIGVEQTFKLGLLGTSSYHIHTGKFLSSKNLREADFKYNRRSDPIWFSNPLYSFQGLDSSLPSKQVYYEAHFVHHDNGAILNKIPFMKKTRIGLVVGAGALYVQEFDWEHYELIAGLERIFKLSKRRLRLGVYGVISDGNKITPNATWKVSFALLDNRRMKWNF